MTTVEKIHKEIDTAQELLLEEANRIIDNVKSSPIENGKRLEKLGFVNTPDAIKSRKLLTELDENKNLSEMIISYSQRYPFLKFITEKRFDKICKKYNLIYAPVSNYKKNVPTKNILEIENVQKLYMSDYPHNNYIFRITDNFTLSNSNLNLFQQNKVSRGIEINWDFNPRDNSEIILSKYFNKKVEMRWATIDREIIEINRKDVLFIAAPKSHFNLKGLKKQKLGFFNFMRIEPVDPIVFRYVNGGIQIISKWGDEANDTELIVPKLN